MKKLLVALLFCGSISANDLTSLAQDTNQSNEAIVSPTSVMSNTQINSGVTFDSYGGGVTCARPTIQVGAVGNFNGQRKYNTGTQVYVGVNIPFGAGSDCESAARAQTFLNKQRRLTMKEVMRRANETHKHEMKKKDLMYADLLAKVCLNFHSQVVADNDSVMAKECKTYKVINHHKPSYDPSSYTRVSGH